MGVEDDITQHAERVAELAKLTRARVAVAESLTAGRISQALGAAPEASEWYRGSVVAYAPEVKFGVLGVRPGPVNTASCAAEMAAGVCELLDADVAVSATGVGGPDPDEGVPAGTVYVALALRGRSPQTEELRFDGPPERVIEETTRACVRWVLEGLALRDRMAAGTEVVSAEGG